MRKSGPLGAGTASWPYAAFLPGLAGGFRDFTEIGNGGFYMSPEHEGTFRFS